MKKQKKFLKQRTENARFQLTAQPILYGSLMLIDGGIFTIPSMLIATAFTGTIGGAMDYRKDKRKIEFNLAAGQKLKGPKWAKDHAQKLEKKLIQSIRDGDSGKKQKILNELQDLESYIDIVDKNEYTEIYYVTQSGYITNSKVRGSLINSKGQARFLKPSKTKGPDR